MRLAAEATALRLAAFLFVLAMSAGAEAQGLTGSISGTVRDETTGVLPGVTVTISSPSLIGGIQTRATEDNGSYRFPVLPPGDYTVTFEMSGFGRVERSAITVQPDRTVTLDQVLRPATISEQVTVTGESPLVDVKSTQVANIVDQTIAREVPVVRRFTDLLNVMPGVQNGLYTFSPINAVYGSRVTDNNYSVDGVNFNDPQVQSAVTDIPYDDIQEVQVSTSGQFAEFGSASGGIFNFITKSGGNQLRGLASFYGQNKRFAANNISSELAAIGIRPTVLDSDYEAGGNLGGPIKRDRLWFFGSYYRQNQERSQSDFPVPIETTQWTVTGQGRWPDQPGEPVRPLLQLSRPLLLPVERQLPGRGRSADVAGHRLSESSARPQLDDGAGLADRHTGAWRIDLVRPAEHRAEHRCRHAGVHREHHGCGDWWRQHDRRPGSTRPLRAQS